MALFEDQREQRLQLFGAGLRISFVSLADEVIHVARRHRALIEDVLQLPVEMRFHRQQVQAGTA